MKISFSRLNEIFFSLRIAQMWAMQCEMELDYVRIAWIDKAQVKVCNLTISLPLNPNIFFQFGQNIARFEFSSHLDLSENRVKKLIDYWANSYDAEVVNLIDSFQFKASENEYNHNYFTQMAWALTDRIGENRISLVSSIIRKQLSMNFCIFMFFSFQVVVMLDTRRMARMKKPLCSFVILPQKAI